MIVRREGSGCYSLLEADRSPSFVDEDLEDRGCQDPPELSRKTNHRRRNRPNLYIPGFSEEGSHIEIRRKNTPDGPLIIGEEVSSRQRRGLFSRDDIDSGLESSFSLLSIADESGLHDVEPGRPSVGLNTAHIPEEDSESSVDDVEPGRPSVGSDTAHIPEEDSVSSLHDAKPSRPSVGLNTAHIPEDESADVFDNEESNSSTETASFLEDSSKLLDNFSDDFGPLSMSSSVTDSLLENCCHGNVPNCCDECHIISSNSRKSIGLNTVCQSFRDISLGSSDKQSDTLSDIQTEIPSPPITDIKYVKPPIQREMLSFPFPNIVNVPGTSPAQQHKEKVILNSHQKPAFEKSFISAADLLHGKSSAFSSFKSPLKYSPQNALSPSMQTTLIVGGEERLCVATQTGDQGDGDSPLIQYLPALDGRMPGSPSKDRVINSKYLSPLSLDTRTTGEIWEDIVHSSDRKYREGVFVNKAFSSSGSQTETVNNRLNNPPDDEFQSELIGYENAKGDAGSQSFLNKKRIRNHIQVPIITDNNRNNNSKSTNTSSFLKTTKPLGRKIVGGSHKPLRRLFSELPVSTQSNIDPVNLSTTQHPVISFHNPPCLGALPTTPVQDRKRMKSKDLTPTVQPESKPRGRALRKAGSSLQTRKAKVRAIRPRQSLSDGETDQNDPPVSMEMSPCQNQTKIVSYHSNLSNTSIDVTLDIKTSTPVKTTEFTNLLGKKMNDNSFSSSDDDFQQSSAQINTISTEAQKTPSYFSPLLSSTSDEIDLSGSETHGRRLRPMNIFPSKVEVTSPFTPPTATQPGLKLNIKTDIELSPSELDTITKIHTICNGQRLVEYLKCSDSPMILTHYPPPKAATKIQWRSELEKEVDDPAPTSPVPPSPATPKPILTQRPKSFKFPYSDEAPSPILLTKTRRQNLLSPITQHTSL